MANRLLKARSTLVKPYWIEDGIWEKLCEHWKSEDFITRSEQARINRASNNGASHTGGSISASQHRANMVKLLLYIICSVVYLTTQFKKTYFASTMHGLIS